MASKVTISVQPYRGGYRVEVRGGGLDADSERFATEAEAVAKAIEAAAELEKSGAVDAKTRRVHGGGQS